MTQPPEVLHQVVARSPNQEPSFIQTLPGGSSLRRDLADRVFDPPKKLRIFSSLVEIVAFLHQQGIVHRSLCPDFLYYVDSSDTLCLTGFEQAIHLGDEHAARLTPSAYTAPEQCGLGSDSVLIEPRSDLFSLGAILYELITERPPFTGSGPALLLALLEAAPPPPRDLAERCPPALEALCLQLLSKEKQERPASAAQVLEALRALDALPEAPQGDAPQAPAALASDDRYEVLEEIARGGLGRVRRAYDRRLARPVAMKELLRPGVGEPEARFLREALITARLEHPGIVPIHDIGRQQVGGSFYTMKLVEGRSLDKLIEERRLFEDRLALLPNLIAACEAVAFAHTRDVIHRDLKPQNILVGAFGETIVIDWGLAKELRQPEPQTPREFPYQELAEQGLTHAGTILGTPAYMPLEQAHGAPVDARADVYSLGAILYQVLSGQPPYVRSRSLEVLAALVEGPPPPLEERQPEIPKDLVDIVNKAMSREARDRYPSARELVEDLKRFTTGQLVGAHQYTSGELLRRWFKKNRLLVSAGLTLAGTILAAVVIDDIRVRDQQTLTEKKRREIYEQRELIQMQNDRLDIENEKQKKSLEELKLSQAISWLDVDPLMSLSWLHDLDREHPNQPWDFVRLIAFAAEFRGLPTSVLGASWSTPACVSQSASRGLVFSLGGASLISGEDDGSLRVWSVKTSECRTLRAHKAAINQLALSPDGASLASVSQDGTVLLWDTSTWSRALLDTAISPVNTVAFSGDGRLLAWGGAFSEIVVWSLEQKKVAARLGAPEGQFNVAHTVSRLAFQPEGGLLASVRFDGVVQLWDVSRKKRYYQSAKEGLPLWLQTGVLFFADGKRLLSFGENFSELIVLEVASKRRLVLEKSLMTTAAAISPDDRWVVASDTEGVLWLWDLRDGAKKRASRLIEGHASKANSLQFSADSQTIISGSEDRTLRVFSLQGEPLWVLRGAKAGVKGVALSAAGLLASASHDNLLRLWDLSSLTRLAGHTDNIWELAFSSKGEALVSTSMDASAKIWQTRPLLSSPIQSFSAPQTAWILSANFSPGGYWVAMASDDNSLYLRSLDGKETKLLHTFTLSPTAVRFTADGNFLWVTSAEGTLTAWEIPSGRLFATILAPADAEERPLADLALFPDGKRAITSSYGGRLRLWDLEKQRYFEAPSVKTNFNTFRLALSPKGKYAVAVGESAQILFWDLERNETQLLSEHKGIVSGASFASDESFLTAGADSILRLWDVATKKSIAIPLGMGAYNVAFDKALTQLAYATRADAVFTVWLRQIKLRSFPEVEVWLQSKRLPPKKTL